ncbi:MAG TPA: TetR/AcrR family transcriptional regulator [Armatimonadota bacterium]|nr:TetR/AcrR family transcriptional regulator [Armatimonadota bacterium]HOS42601.1 TetR/AcrR family transcriptional regulator [Armatimonadota bacterium]
MNKKERILAEAKRLFGTLGYLGFTLKQLAQACNMTSPALYYFYPSKADLFKECLLSEFARRREVTERCAAESSSLPEFVERLVLEGIDVCEASHFRTGQAMGEIIHLPDELREEIQAAWDRQLIAPVQGFLERIHPNPAPAISRYLLASYIIQIATYSAAQCHRFTRDELAAFFTIVAGSLDDAAAQRAPVT